MDSDEFGWPEEAEAGDQAIIELVALTDDIRE